MIRQPAGNDDPLLGPAAEGAEAGADFATYREQVATELAVLDEQLVPAIRELEREAAIEQNRVRRQQVLLILGGFLTTTFGAVQAALSDAAWPGIVVAGVGAFTSAVASVGRQSGAVDAYLASRWRAERLKSAYFTLLAEPPGDDPDAWACTVRRTAVELRYEDPGAVA